MTVGINVLKLCFDSEFEISRGADLEHFRKVSHFVTCHVTVLVRDNYCSSRLSSTPHAPRHKTLERGMMLHRNIGFYLRDVKLTTISLQSW